MVKGAPPVTCDGNVCRESSTKQPTGWKTNITWPKGTFEWDGEPSDSTGGATHCYYSHNYGLLPLVNIGGENFPCPESVTLNEYRKYQKWKPRFHNLHNPASLSPMEEEMIQMKEKKKIIKKMNLEKHMS